MGVGRGTGRWGQGGGGREGEKMEEEEEDETEESLKKARVFELTTSKMVSCVVKCLCIGVACFRALVYRTLSLQRLDEAGATRRTYTRG